ncbi:MAG: hypothetical protein ABUK01_08190 [Leptospirales bacterium]
MEKKATSIERILDEAMELEKKSEYFYRSAAKEYEGSDGQMVFLQLAEEEAVHQKLITRLEASSPEDFRVQVLKIDFSPIRMFGESPEFANKPDLEHVLRFALRMEEVAVEYYRELGKVAIGSLIGVLKQLEEMECSHVKRITRLLDDAVLNKVDDMAELHAH